MIFFANAMKARSATAPNPCLEDPAARKAAGIIPPAYNRTQ